MIISLLASKLLEKKELEKFKPSNFDYIIIDEFHHVGAKVTRFL